MATKIGIRIMERRQQLGLTQEELAFRMGYKTKSAINKIELGINDVSQSKVIKFAEALHTSVAYLMGWDEEQKEKPTATVSDGLSDIDIEISKMLELLSPEQKEMFLNFLTSLLNKQEP